MMLDDLCARLLPPEEHLHFETLIMEDRHISLVAAMTASKAACPACHELSHRIHSGYPRTLADLPWAALPVCMVLNVRRFFCATSLCGRMTFTERLPTVAPLYADHDALAPHPSDDRAGARGLGRCPAADAPGHAGQSQHRAAAGARPSPARVSPTRGRRSRRLGLA